MSPGRWFWRLLCMLALLGPAWLWDRPLFLLVCREGWDGNWNEVLHTARLFAEPLGIAMVLVIVWTLDRPRRWTIVMILTPVVLASLAVTGCKLVIGRHRPLASDGQTVISGPGPEAGSSSFPSGHAAAAFALAFGLCRLYPAGRGLFVAMAAGCAASRVFDGVHFLTDIVVGSWLGWETAAWFWHLAARDRLCARLRSIPWLTPRPQPDRPQLPC